MRNKWKSYKIISVLILILKTATKLKNIIFETRKPLTGGLTRRKITIGFGGGLGGRKIIEHLVLECDPALSGLGRQ
jgi:hypothetical protein